MRSWSEYYIKDLRKINSSNAEKYGTIASNLGRLDQVMIAISLGADGDKALTWASLHGHLDVVKYLVEQGVDIHTQKNKAFYWARQYKNLAVVKYLEEQMRNQ